MNEQPTTKTPIARLLGFGLIFVLIFIGIAYLAYSLSRRNQNTTTTTQSSPISTNFDQAIVKSNQIVLPNPTVKYSTPRAAINSQGISQSIVALPNLAPNKIERTPNNAQQSIIATDGKGNLIIDNLTHEEYFGLEKAKIIANNQLELAKLSASIQLAKIQQEQIALKYQVLSKPLVRR